jgi:hypothetical protein
MMKNKATQILEEIAELDEAQFHVLLNALSMGMWDEWDCDLPTGLTMFGVDEIRIAVRTASIFAASHDKADSN